MNKCPNCDGDPDAIDFTCDIPGCVHRTFGIMEGRVVLPGHNMQQVPRGVNPAIDKMFKPEEGPVWVAYDSTAKFPPEPPKVKVSITTMDGDLLDQFEVTDPLLSIVGDENELARRVRDMLEQRFEVPNG